MFKDGDIVCFLGDSITANDLCMSEVYQYLRKKYKIKCYNCGVSGATATQAVNYLHSECLIHNPDYVVVMYGMNDLGCWLYWDSNTEENIPQKRKDSMEFHKKNYERVVKECLDFGARVIVCLPTPYDEVSDSPAEVAHGYQNVLEEGAKFQLEIARKYNCPVVNYKDALLAEIGKRNVIAEDRIHPTPEGYHIMAQTFLKEIGEKDEADYDTPFEFEDWNKERHEIIDTDLHHLNFVDLCIRYGGGNRKTTEELIEFIKQDYEKQENKEGFVAQAYLKFIDHGEMRSLVKGEVIKKTIF